MKNSGLHIVEIELTNKCNLNCKHCYARREDVTTLNPDKVFELIDELSELNVHRLVFTGGEPLLVKELFDYAIYAKNKGFPRIVLMSNGLLINEDKIDQLKVFDSIQLSIDMPPGDKPLFRYDYLDKLLNKIEFLKKNNINITLQATLHRSLMKSLEKLSEFIKKVNVPVGINRLVPINDDLKSETLTKDELKKALELILKMKKVNKLINCSDILLFLLDSEFIKSFVESKRITGGCIAGVASLYINSRGDVLPCPFIKYPVANVFNESLNKIWFNNSVLKQLRNRDSFKGKCGSCRFNSFCGGCRASSFYNNGSLFGSDKNCFL